VALADGGVPEEMLKLVSVLFADVVSSTARAERMHPEDTRTLMADYFAAMAAEIEAEGGTIEKFVGDAVMAVFGVPTAHEDDALRAVRAARRMLARLQRWNGEREAAERIEIRIGINTGDVIAAGAPRRDLLVTGDAVNVAARLQELAAPGTIVVGERTARAVRGHFELRPLDAQALKGKSAPVSVSIVGPERMAVEARGIPGLAAPLVGRRRELELLRTTLARAEEERRPHLVTLVGDAGVGKSRLVREFVASLDVATKVVFGRCLPYGQGVTLWPLVEILKGEATILDTDDPHVALDKIRALVQETIPPGLVADEERFVAALASTVGLEMDDDPLAELGPRELYRELLGAWRVLFSSLSAGQAMVAVVEDIHWADESMLRLLDELAERGDGPLIFLCPARPDLLRTRPDWGGGRRNAATITIDALNHEESERLVSLLLDVDELPGDLRGRMLERSEGNPFYLEEIVHQLIDEGLLQRVDERWRAREGIADVEIPDTVQAVILARLDLLEPEERGVAQAASVVGRVFWAGAVARLARPADVHETLQTLRRRELVLDRLTSSMAGDDEYIFKHVLIRDVAYESLPRKERARLHAEAAGWLEERTGDRVGELAELLAHHYDAANSLAPADALRDQARAQYLEAARNAARRNALGQLERFGRRSVELSPGHAERIEALEVMGDLYYRAFHGDGAWAAYREALEELDESDEAFARLAAKAAIIPGRWLGSVAELPDFEELDELVDRGLVAAGEAASRDRAVLLITRAFMQLQYLRRDDRLEPALQEGLEIAERLDDADLLSMGLDAMMSWVEGDGRYDEGWKVIERRLSLIPRQRDPKEIGDAYAMAAWNMVNRGLYAESERYATECIEQGRGIDVGTHLHGLTWRVRARFALGDWDGALADQHELEQLQEEAARELPPGFTLGSYTAAALCHELRGERAEADHYLEIARRSTGRVREPAGGQFAPAAARALAHRGLLDEASTFVPETERSIASGRWLEAQCEIAAYREDWDGAQALLVRARTEAAECGLLALPFFADRLEGRRRAALAEPEAGAAMLLKSAEGFRQLGAVWEEAWSRLLAAEALLAVDGGRARDEAARALKEFERLRSVEEHERALRVLDRVTV
jgi:class 3 adenylate cyclase